MHHHIMSSLILHTIIENHFQKKNSIMIIFFVSPKNVRNSHGVCRHFKSKIQVLRLYIKTLYEAMIIDFHMFTSRPFAMQWSLISLCLNQDPLRRHGHWFSYVYIKAPCNAMVIDFLMFTSRPSTKQWSWFFSSLRPYARQWSSISLHQGHLRGKGHWFLCHIDALCEAMVINCFTSRSSMKQWSLISLCLHQNPLRGNGHWFLCHIEALYEAMVIDLFPFDIDPFLRIGLICFFKESENKIIKQSDLSDQNPLLGNGHRIFWI